ncbi:MAG: chemotaxis protein CheA [Pseudomonadota bacterium]
MDDDLEEIRALFLEETVEGLEILEQGLLNLQPGPPDVDQINDIFRAAHSIKGGAATFGFDDVAAFTHDLETVLDEMRGGKRDVEDPTVELLLIATDCLGDLISGAQALEDQKVAEIQQQLQDALNATAEDTADGAPQGTDAADLGDESRAGHTDSDSSTGHTDSASSGHTDSAEGQAADSPSPEGQTLPASEGQTLPAEAVGPQGPAAEGASSSDAKAAKDAGKESGSIRVSIDKIDDLLNLVGELVITQSMLKRFGEVEEVSLFGLRDGLDQLERHTRELQESVMQIRMLPIRVCFSRFPRLVRDLSAQMGKEIELVVLGDQTELDKTVLEKIGDPLVHLVRNSLDHGIESPDDREAAGKSRKGTLTLSAYHESGKIVIEVKDDGKGLDHQKILNKAIEKGLVGRDEQLSDERIASLVFMAGFSTAQNVTDVSGRGVGMDVVRRNIKDLGGTVEVNSVQGQGTTFTIRLPLTLAILDGQLVSVAGETYIISLLSIVETIQLTTKDIHTLAGRGRVCRIRGEYIPVTTLAEAFGDQTNDERQEEGLLVVLESDGKQLGLLVDELKEQQQVVIKSLEENYRPVEGLSGATILGDGTVSLILDVQGLVQRRQKASISTDSVTI